MNKDGANEPVPDNKSKYEHDYEEEAGAIRRYGSGDITYSSRTGSYMDLRVPEESRRFFVEFTDHGMPVYIVGVTSNPADFNDITKDTYVRMRMGQKEVMLGQWTSPGGVTYRDVI